MNSRTETASEAARKLLGNAMAMIEANPDVAAEHFRAGIDQLGEIQSEQEAQLRVRLGASFALAVFAASHPSAASLEESCLLLSQSLQLAEQLPFPELTPASKTHFEPVAALTLLQQTLAGLTSRGCIAFAFAGVLLGLVREGKLLDGDKDLDVVVPLSHFQPVLKLLEGMGWAPARVAVNAVNFRCFTHVESGITLDIFAYDFLGARVDGGWWPAGLPRSAGRLLNFAPFTLEQTEAECGRYWQVAQPEKVLAALYGEGWQQPDPGYDSTLETPALVRFNTYTLAWASLKAVEAWTHGRREKLGRVMATIRRQDPGAGIGRFFR